MKKILRFSIFSRNFGFHKLDEACGYRRNFSDFFRNVRGEEGAWVQKSSFATEPSFIIIAILPLTPRALFKVYHFLMRRRFDDDF